MSAITHVSLFITTTVSGPDMIHDIASIKANAALVTCQGEG